jgi:hypothetical protein
MQGVDDLSSKAALRHGAGAEFQHVEPDHVTRGARLDKRGSTHCPRRLSPSIVLR